MMLHYSLRCSKYLLILCLHVMQEEARPFGLEINWSKTKIQTTVDPLPTQQVKVDGNVVDMVDSFTYLGSLVDRNGRSEAELVRRIAIARNCMTSLDRNIWRSSISVSTKIRLYSVCVLPVFLCGAETWTLTKAMAAKVDAFDQWCQRRILRIHYRRSYSQQVTNAEVRGRTDCLPLSEIIRSRRLRCFGYVARHRRRIGAELGGAKKSRTTFYNELLRKKIDFNA